MKIDIESLPVEDRVRKYRMAAKVMRVFAARIPLRAEYYLLRACKFEELAESLEKQNLDS